MKRVETSWNDDSNFQSTHASLNLSVRTGASWSPRIRSAAAALNTCSYQSAVINPRHTTSKWPEVPLQKDRHRAIHSDGTRSGQERIVALLTISLIFGASTRSHISSGA